MKDSHTITTLLRDRNLKATSSRIDLIHVLAKAGHAVAHSSLQKALKKSDRVTIYRNLQTLMEQGIIHQAMVDDHETYYALCSERCDEESHNHQHVHFKCTKCETVKCVPINESVQLNLPGHTVEQIDIEVKGTCAKCQRGKGQRKKTA